MRRVLGDEGLRISDIERTPLGGGLSGSPLERWLCSLQHSDDGVAAAKLVYKGGNLVRGEFLNGAAQREVSAYAAWFAQPPLPMPTYVAGLPQSGDLWMLEMPPGKQTSHWHADWDAHDVLGQIDDLARLHALYHGNPPHAPWLLQPITSDAERLLGDGRRGMAQMLSEGRELGSLTHATAKDLLQVASKPQPLLASLQAASETLLHGDPSPHNVRILTPSHIMTNSQSMTYSHNMTQVQRLWYDWQLAGRGPAALDWIVVEHFWVRPAAACPVPFATLRQQYLSRFSRYHGSTLDGDAFNLQCDAALVYRFLVQWAPLVGLYSARLQPQVAQNLSDIWQRLHFPALERMMRLLY